MLNSPGPHIAVGPPCISSTHGYFLPGCAFVGFITQYWTRVPSGRVSQCSSGIDRTLVASHDEFRSVSWRIELLFPNRNSSCGLGTPIRATTIFPPPSPKVATPVGPCVSVDAVPPLTLARSSGSPPCQGDVNNTLPSDASSKRPTPDSQFGASQVRLFEL